ncbi:hypothetical protein SZ63_11305 [Methanoculleus sediminis]|uniref:Uncharacterized protein n=1 Tax=Methanoculleus sediminis TaxID=1550566 RepID=A0A0H1QX09_9EURY|nr:hypothetical protein [Methanoculleus sediminis]KLK87186.1 hypothetical protein SZ63_11305 [Methanoculleus sediminis]
MLRENIRRPLLFLITVGTGSLIIVLDATAEVVIAGTVLAGFLALVVTGALDLAELKPSRLRTALRERGKKVQPDAPVEKPGAPAESPVSTPRRPFSGIDLSSISGMLGTFKASALEAIAHARAPEREKKSSIEQIDAMLDQTVEGTVPDPAITPAPPKAGGNTADPLASLADLDIDSLEGLDIDGESSGPGTMFEPDQISLLSVEDADAISDILKSHQSELEDLDISPGIDLAGNAGESDAALPPVAADVPELPGDDGVPDMNALSDELSTLDELDLDEIEIEGEEEEEDEADADEPVPEEDILGEIEEETKEDFDMVSFASGGAVEDDLITALKADAKKKKFVEDISLIRELKGETFHAKDLATELEDVLTAMKSQR